MDVINLVRYHTFFYDSVNSVFLLLDAQYMVRQWMRNYLIQVNHKIIVFFFGILKILFKMFVFVVKLKKKGEKRESKIEQEINKERMNDDDDDGNMEPFNRRIKSLSKTIISL